ncbi:hypothetical protein B2G71_00865 [Novosphingobium sp. PC22D]|uniref:CHAD domain-containing protein n=1 Tax=Novosphingobium sp. PC22D TaxID=1962403 RepID=UPI000BEF922D|nr:CHAD domain-containing protein [Novosphingobium sp. PC22D]PEQ14194.1 hypothetical protein B2G71_00865 [Novosphingobium sp. PC22D]
MAYRLKRKDKSIEDALRRIACEQIDRALRSIAETGTAEAVHDVRKRCKKLRGLVRLVRPAFDGYSARNAAFRDIAGHISHARDAKVMQDTYDALMHHFHGRVDRRALGSIRRRFTLDYKEAAREDIGEALEQARAELEVARAGTQDWSLSADGWEAVGAGLAKTYKKGCKAAAAAIEGGRAEDFHELRKRTKYHWFHTRLLVGMWPEFMGVRARTAKAIADTLGDHHDLAVFETRLAAEPDRYGSPRDVETAIGLARGRRSRLESEARPLIDRLFAQDPDALRAHCETLWHAWKAPRLKAV